MVNIKVARCFFRSKKKKCKLKIYICLNKKIPRTFVDAHTHIPNMHRAIFVHMCIFDVHFGAFGMIKLALKCKKELFIHCGKFH